MLNAEKLARKEIESAAQSCFVKSGGSYEKYDKLSLNERKRTVWNDDNF